MYRTSEETQKRKDEKRQLILDTAAKVFSAKGYHNTTVKDIVRDVSSVGSFYFNFDSKEELFLELYKDIEKQFKEVTESVLDVKNYPLLKNFTRVMSATLWMYEQKREIARIMLHEAAAGTVLQRLEEDRIKETVNTMSIWFKRFGSHNSVNIPNERIAAFMYVGTYYCLINDWLSSDSGVPLTAYCYEFCVYNLQSLKISFDEETVKKYINEVLQELSAGPEKQKE